MFCGAWTTATVRMCNSPTRFENNGAANFMGVLSLGNIIVFLIHEIN